MLSYTQLRNRFGDLCNTSSSATLILADNLMNFSAKRIASAKDWPWKWRQYTLLTVASTVTVTIASPGVFTLTGHGFSLGTVVYFSTTGALPTGLTAGNPYYVIAAGLTANAFEVSTAINGAAVNTTGTQSGTHTVTTQMYTLPAYTEKPQSIYVTVGGYRYTPDEVTNREEWDALNEVVVNSNIVTHYFIYDGRIELFPKPTAAATITFNARRILKDLSVADYTTGNIDIATYGSTLITGAGSPAWASPMNGRWIKITPTNVAATSGDGFWYEIDAVTSATTLILKRPYAGTTIATGNAAAYTIGEMSLIPEPHDTLPLWEALQIYFTSVAPDAKKAQLYAVMFKDGYAQMFADYTSKANVVLDDGGGSMDINPNLLISY